MIRFYDNLCCNNGATRDYVVKQGFRGAILSEATALYAGSGEAIYFADNGLGGPYTPPELYMPDKFSLAF
jgi:hypothetical protein